jgi:hypothetical protein
MSLKSIGVRVIQVEPQTKPHPQHGDHQLWRNLANGSSGDDRPRKQQQQAQRPDQRNFRIHMHDRVRDLSNQVQRLLRLWGDSQHDMDLLPHDDDADRRQHAVNRRGRKHFRKHAGAQKREADLNQASHHPHAQRQLLGMKLSLGGGILAAAEFQHTAEDDHDHAGRGAFDRQF